MQDIFGMQQGLGSNRWGVAPWGVLSAEKASHYYIKESSMNQRRIKQGGFTLLELLMVVIIIAILASIAIPQYLRTVIKARRSEALQTLAILRTAEQRYYAQHVGFMGDLTSTGGLDIEGAFDAAAGRNWDFTLAATASATPGAVLVLATGAAGTVVGGCELGVDIIGTLITEDIDSDGKRSGNCVNTP